MAENAKMSDLSDKASSATVMAFRADRMCDRSSDFGDTADGKTQILLICDSIAETLLREDDVTLRARLTAAFLAVVLGPVLLGAIFVGIAVAAVSDQRAMERLDAGVQNVNAALAVTCQRLRLAAETTALVTADGDQPDAAQRAVTGDSPARWR